MGGSEMIVEEKREARRSILLEPPCHHGDVVDNVVDWFWGEVTHADRWWKTESEVVSRRETDIGERRHGKWSSIGVVAAVMLLVKRHISISQVRLSYVHNVVNHRST